MKLTFLGTGTSFGVPVIGCDCDTCASPDPRDRRTRHAAIVEAGGRSLLVDTPPELRIQLLRAGVTNLDAVWYTHTHADHIHGIDDLRVFQKKGPVRVFISAEHKRRVVSSFPYIFGADAHAGPRSTIPKIDLRIFDGTEPLRLLGHQATPLRVPHGRGRSYGLRIGPLGYVTDAKSLPDRTLRALEGVRVLVLNALWFGDPHPAHFSVEEAVEAARQVGAERTYLTHLTHRVSQKELDQRLPDGFFAAYDGLTIEVPSAPSEERNSR
ncbi:MAG: MBL fold metallo-hydrolase [Gemmatimonadetes bacterium]|nr:MBL fold metallo-hydrolase [Gemmatimonadota bacterium]